MDTQALILKHLLPLVPFDGWTAYAFSSACKQAGVSQAEAQAAFPGGIDDCIDYFFAAGDAWLKDQFPAGALAHERMPARIRTLVLAQLAHYAPAREALRRGLATRMLPWNILSGGTALYRSVDVMWRLAGDNALDFSFYTKRATLAALYSATLLYWLNDDSINCENTAGFLDRRLRNLADFGRWKQRWRKKA